MKTTVLLIRHGETEWNQLGKFQGCTDIELSKDGIKQAELLRDRLNGDFDYIYASPLKRAYETARVISEDTDFEGRIKAGASILNVSASTDTPKIVAKIREEYPKFPI